jgi:DNA replication protein DnaC
VSRDLVIGRLQSELSELERTLAEGRRSGVVIMGAAGVGKTRLAAKA